MTRDEDDESRPERIKQPYRCKDRTCGAEDCATCYPTTYDQAQTSDEREEQEQFDKYGKIKTSHDRPPIPDRSFDWSAVTDNYDLVRPIGHGATEAEAIADLKQQIEDNSNE